jgi:hypothetical protein
VRLLYVQVPACIECIELRWRGVYSGLLQVLRTQVTWDHSSTASTFLLCIMCKSLPIFLVRHHGSTQFIRASVVLTSPWPFGLLGACTSPARQAFPGASSLEETIMHNDAQSCITTAQSCITTLTNMML